MMEKQKVLIAIPVFNDWESLERLIQNIDSVPNIDRAELSILVVNDGSSFSMAFKKEQFDRLKFINNIDVLELTKNVGHQRAITLALPFIKHNYTCDAVVVMDSDGEDKPEDIFKLIDASNNSPGQIIFASRTQRSEGLGFKFFYQIYKWLFRLLTGSKISFGNFCLIPSAQLQRLIFVSELWNHFAAGVLFSKIPIKSISSVRGVRLLGQSKMTLASLFIHGLSAISVYIETVAVRLLIFLIILVVFSVMAIMVVVGIKFSTSLAIPGWATYVVIGFLSILTQALTMAVLLIFLVLSYRTQKHFIPYFDYKEYILKNERIH
jgi:glycosyltransferase involved in cell wall biosynthesis